MVFSKKDKIIEFLLFGYLILFPFGQLLRIKIPLQTGYLAILPSDLIVLLFVLVSLKRKSFNKPLIAVICTLLFSYILNIFIYSFPFLPAGGYILRLIAYLLFWFELADIVKTNKTRKLLENSLLVMFCMVGIFGWLQYFVYPDLRPLYPYGWDDHLNRMAGTFLDPGFLGIVLSFGFVYSVIKFFELEKRVYGLLSIGFFISTCFTYSRASLLATAIAFVFVTFKYKKYILLIGSLILMSLVVLKLPKTIGEGTNLLRTFSIESRLKNYYQTVDIFKKDPVFGIGYNNLCFTKDKIDSLSHSCSGADNGILMVASTLGVFGLFAFIYFLTFVISDTAKNSYGKTFSSFLILVFVHTQFTNSIFYPSVLGVLGVQYAISRKRFYSE